MVYAVKGKNSYDNTRKILEAAGNEFINNVRSPLLIKPNLVADSRHEGATTDPEAVKAVVEYLKEKTNVEEIIIAEGSSGDTEKAFDVLGYRTIFDALRIPLKDLNKDQPTWIDGVDPLRGRPIKIPIAQSVRNARYIISCVLPKTHDHGIVTLGIKNLIGVVPGTKWKKTLHGGVYPDELSDQELKRSIRGFHQNVYSIFREVGIDFTIIDGTVGMEGNGPISGKPKAANFGLGGFDAVATDAIGTFLMGFDPYEIGYIYLSEKGGLGKADISKIQVNLEGWISLRKKFKPHSRYSNMHYKP
ncbi:MAG: DUF362 domain-containing protein [Thermoplasmata archaeon]|nr:MAG: DUF362 domain-containing protein [Thermoplasmata archaeon]